jgi:SAM-dependent methyltransferase
LRASYELAGCPACGAGEFAVVTEEGDVRRQHELLWEFHLARVKPDTPPARLHDRTVFSQPPPLRLVACARCGTVYRSPRETRTALVETYAQEPLDDTVLEAILQTQTALYQSQMRRFVRVAGKSGNGIEVGSYVGGFLTAAQEFGWQFQGVDVNEQATAFARSKQFRVLHGAIEDAPGGQPVDAVAIWNCFDQLPDPRAALRAAHALLRERGTLVIRVPNGAFYSTLSPRAVRGSRAAIAMLAWNNLLGFPYRHGFTPRSLRVLLESEGFRVVRKYGDTLAPLSDDWTLPWAAREERLLKRGLRLLRRTRLTPWFEMYARKSAASN